MSTGSSKAADSIEESHVPDEGLVNRPMEESRRDKAMNSIHLQVPLHIRSDTIDPQFNNHVIESAHTALQPEEHHRVCGYFETATVGEARIHFNFYFPPKSSFRNRFFQCAYPTQKADAEPDCIRFAFESGGYAIQCTGALGYRHEAATAKLSRQVAGRYYEIPPESIYGYIYGGSGGSYTTIAALENTTGVWQGGVPFVQAGLHSMPDAQSVLAVGTLVLADKLDDIADAVSPGGSGKPWETLNSMEAEILEEVTKCGLPLRAWETIDYHSEPVDRLVFFYHSIRRFDPTFADDFWNLPGYVGTEESELGNFFRAKRIRHSVVIRNAVLDSTGAIASIHVPDLPSKHDLRGYDLSVVDVDGQIIAANVKGTLDPNSKTVCLSPALPATSVDHGNRLQYDNSWFLASHLYYRYHLPKQPGFHTWDQFRCADGSPRYAVRPIEVGPIMASLPLGGASMTGSFDCKMIVVQNMLDVDTFSWAAEWYKAQVIRAQGPSAYQRYRLWHNDWAHHLNGKTLLNQSCYVPYDGIFYQALRDVADWAESDILPPESTRGRIEEGQLVIPGTAAERRGVQPYVQVAIKGAKIGHVSPGDEVDIIAHATTPPGSGFITRAEWDFSGKGEWQSATIDRPASSMTFSTTYVWRAAGKHFVAFRAASTRGGTTQERLTLIYNIDRARVVVVPAAA